MRHIILLAFLLISQQASACFAARIPIEKRVELAKYIAVGWVTEKYLTEFEKRIENPAIPVTTHEEYSIGVKLIENIKGYFKSDKIYPKIISCGSGEGELKQKVLVFYDNEYWFVMPFSEEKYETVMKSIKSH